MYSMLDPCVIPVIQMIPREDNELGTEHARHQRSHYHRVPIRIVSRPYPLVWRYHGYVDYYQIMDVHRTYNRAFANKVMYLKCEKVDPDTFEVYERLYPVIPDVVQYHPVTNDIINITFWMFEPRDHIKLHIPIVYTGIDQSPVLKKGGSVHIPY